MQVINKLLYDIGSAGILFLEILSGIVGIVGFVFAAKEKEKRKRLVVVIILAFLIWCVSSYAGSLAKVPNVIGDYYDDACGALVESHLKYIAINNPKDYKVTWQSIDPDSIVKKNTIVELATESCIDTDDIKTGNENNNLSDDISTLDSVTEEKLEDELNESEEEKTGSASSEDLSSEAGVKDDFTYKEMSETMYAVRAVNVRDLPNTDGQILGTLEKNQEIHVTGQCNESNWFRLDYNGNDAYVSNIYVSNEKADDNKDSQNKSTVKVNEGQNPTEAAELMKYINQHRVQNGLHELTWNTELENAAQMIADPMQAGGLIQANYYPIGRQCNGAKTAKKAVSDWITGNDWIPSEAGALLNAEYTQMGGAMYYLPNGNEYGYHYFWVVCLQ